MSSRYLRAVSASLLALAVLATLLFGSAAHALVPHEHGESHGEAAIWNSLHASLRHDEKQALVADGAIDMHGAVVPLIVPRTGSVQYARRARSIPDPHLAALRRGVVAHRKFR